jgi:hypothetical protein
MPTTTDSQAAARHVAQRQRHLLEHPRTPAPRAPEHVVLLPLLAIHAAAHLPTSPRLLFLHLWTTARAVTHRPIPTWFYHTDAQLTRETGLSTRTLARCRADLEDRALVWHTDNQGQGKVETYWHLRWPCPLAPDAPRWIMTTWADEHAASGEPLTRLQAWAELARYAPMMPPLARTLALELVRVPPGLLDLRLRYASEIAEVSSWLYHQLAVYAPELYRRDVVHRTLIASGQQCLSFTPETALPSA